jgi:hypothetical protein
MRIIKTIDQIISESVETHIQTCIDRVKHGFKVVEIEVQLQYASKVFTQLNEEISYGKRINGWEFGVFSQGEFEGKMAQTFTKDGAEYKRYFLKYTL